MNGQLCILINRIYLIFHWLVVYVSHEILSVTFHWMPKSHIYSTPKTMKIKLLLDGPSIQ